jgi:molybdenum cofactor cytidylyltransferase
VKVEPSIAIIIVAAGMSVRFGRNKLLEKVGGEVLIKRVVSQALMSKATHVIVVLGHQADVIKEALQGLSYEFVFNDEYAKGMSTSVKKGLSIVERTADAVIIIPGDVVLVDAKIIDTLIDNYVGSKSPIIIASYQGKSGHPILIDRNLFDEVKTIDEKTFGLKKVVSRNRSKIRFVETSDRVLFDLDTPKDLEKLRNFLIPEKND